MRDAYGGCCWANACLETVDVEIAICIALRKDRAHSERKERSRRSEKVICRYYYLGFRLHVQAEIHGEQCTGTTVDRQNMTPAN